MLTYLQRKPYFKMVSCFFHYYFSFPVLQGTYILSSEKVEVMYHIPFLLGPIYKGTYLSSHICAHFKLCDREHMFSMWNN